MSKHHDAPRRLRFVQALAAMLLIAAATNAQSNDGAFMVHAASSNPGDKENQHKQRQVQRAATTVPAGAVAEEVGKGRASVAVAAIGHANEPPGRIPQPKRKQHKVPGGAATEPAGAAVKEVAEEGAAMDRVGDERVAIVVPAVEHADEPPGRILQLGLAKMRKGRIKESVELLELAVEGFERQVRFFFQTGRPSFYFL